MGVALKRLRLGEMAGLVFLVLFGVAAFTPLPNRLARELVVASRLERADAIVVLGGGVDGPRTLSMTSLQRMIHGLELYRSGLAPTLVFSGGRAGQTAAESVLMADLAIALGVPRAAVYAEAVSNDTWTHARELARVDPHSRPRKIILVTDVFHIKRAAMTFERAGFEVLAAPVNTSAVHAWKPEQRLDLVRRVGVEAIARVYYSARGVL